MQFSAVYVTSDLIINGKTYTEGGLHRPPLNAVITANTSPVVDYWTAVTPRPGEEYSVMELPTPSGHTGVIGGEYDPATTVPMRFIHVKLAAHVYNKEHVFGWIDDVSVKVMHGDKKVIVIHWHVDWFLTMKSEVSYGAGRILRGPQSLARPDPTLPRRWEESSKTRIYTELDPLDPTMYSEAMWIILCVVTTVNGVSHLDYLFWKSGYGIASVGVGPYLTPSLTDVFNGLTEEKLSLNSGSIQGVWLSPVAPYTPDYAQLQVSTDQQYAAFVGKGTGQYITKMDVREDGESIMTDDDRKISILDTTGNVIFNAPWGVPFKEIQFSVDIGTAGANLQIYLNDDLSAYPVFKASEGRFSSFPLPSLPVTSNAWQDYNYSGQRDYDIRMREIQKNQAAINGIAGVGSSAIGGAVAGSLAGGPAGTAAGAIAGIVSSTVGTAVSYVSAGHFDKKTQNAVDKLMSSQTETVIAPTQGYRGIAPIMKGPGWYILYMVRDPVSAAEMSDEHSELGYLTDSYSTNCTSVISGGGGLKIEGLVTYGVSTEASRYIEALFARGVHIDISSP